MRIEVEGGFLEYRSAPAGTVEIVNINVHGKRHAGIGRRLVAILERISPNNTIYCFSRVENTIAHRFYESLGFKNIATISAFYTENASKEFGDTSGNAVLFFK